MILINSPPKAALETVRCEELQLELSAALKSRAGRPLTSASSSGGGGGGGSSVTWAPTPTQHQPMSSGHQLNQHSLYSHHTPSSYTLASTAAAAPSLSSGLSSSQSQHHVPSSVSTMSAHLHHDKYGQTTSSSGGASGTHHTRDSIHETLSSGLHNRDSSRERSLHSRDTSHEPTLSSLHLRDSSRDRMTISSAIQNRDIVRDSLSSTLHSREASREAAAAAAASSQSGTEIDRIMAKIEQARVVT